MTEENQSPAKVIFTGLKIGNYRIEVDSVYLGKKLLEHPMEQTRSLTFQHSDKLISVQFTSADIQYADKVKYACKLDGFYEQWQVTPENSLVFSSLPPGDYKLYVKAGNSDGVWSDQVSIMNIAVTPPFYLSGWAISKYPVGY